MPYAIYAEEKVVGLIMAFYEPIDEDDPNDDENIYYLARLMIDKNYQGNGYGKEAMKKIMELMKTFPYGDAEAIILSCSEENKVAYKLYKSLGFVNTEELDEDEDYLFRLNLK